MPIRENAQREGSPSPASLEEKLVVFAAGFPYPPTPDLAARERERLAGKLYHPPARHLRMAPGLALLLIVVLAVLLVSPVRARVLDWIRLGAVRIFFSTPTPAATLAISTGTASPAPTVTVVKSVLDMDGETTLQAARARLDFSLELPAYPADLGEPDHVFLQKFRGWVVTLVWMDPAQPDTVRLVLTEALSNENIFEKFAPESVQDTQVNGAPALWVEGDYLLVTRGSEITFTRLIGQGHTLIWTLADVTYRLESNLELGQAIRIAESIR